MTTSSRTRHKNPVPKPGARLHCGERVRVTRGMLKGREGKTLIVTGSMWLVDLGDRRISLHRRCLERIEAAA